MTAAASGASDVRDRLTSNQIVADARNTIAVRSIAHSACSAPPMRSLQITPGTLVMVKLSDCERDIQLLTSDDAEQMRWQEDSGVEITEQADEIVLVTAATGKPFPATSCRPLTLYIPPRFCSVDIDCRGDVRVDSIKEASAQILTHGGHVHIGSLAGKNANVNTEGGNLSGSITAETVTLNTCSEDGTSAGAVQLKKLLGKTVVVVAIDLRNKSWPVSDPEYVVCDSSSADQQEIEEGELQSKLRGDSLGGHLQLIAVYADELMVLAGHQAVHIGTMQCSESAAVQTAGGSVIVDGLDGNADIITSGGQVRLQLHRNMRTVTVNSCRPVVRSHTVFDRYLSGEDSAAAGSSQLPSIVSLTVDPAVRATTVLRSGSGLHIDEQALSWSTEDTWRGVVPAIGDVDMVSGRLGRSQAAGQAVGTGAGPAEAGTAAGNRIEVAADGLVTLSARSWKDSVMAKVRPQTASP